MHVSCPGCGRIVTILKQTDDVVECPYGDCETRFRPSQGKPQGQIVDAPVAPTVGDVPTADSDVVAEAEKRAREILAGAAELKRKLLADALNRQREQEAEAQRRAAEVLARAEEEAEIIRVQLVSLR